jgi:flagellar protein FlaG
MSNITPISASPSGALPASTHGAEASPRPVSGGPSAPSGTSPARDAQAEPPPPPQKSTTPSELQKQIEATLAESRVQTNLKFRVDEDLRRVVVSVVDSDTGETILQIPDEAALAVARRLADTGTGLLDQKA